MPAQLLSFGVKGGVPLNDEFQTSPGYNNDTKRYIIGPMLQLNLPFGLAVEADGLYKRVGYSSNVTDVLGNAVNAVVRANSWEVPIVVKYHFHGAPLIRPYVGGGYAIQGYTNLSG